MNSLPRLVAGVAALVFGVAMHAAEPSRSTSTDSALLERLSQSLDEIKALDTRWMSTPGLADFMSALIDSPKIFVSRMDFDESSQTYSIQVSVPVLGGDTLIRAICIGVDVETID